MRRHGTALLVVLPLAASVGLTGPAAPAVAAPTVTQEAASRAEVYVNNKDCTPDGDGSTEKPYCTIGAAAAVAQPGQTVLVHPGDYRETVTFDRSGTADAPITYRAVNSPDGEVRVGNHYTLTDTIFRLVGVHDVVLEGFIVATWGSSSTVVVDRSSRITLDGLAVHNQFEAPALVRLTGGSSDVTVSRAWLQAHGGAGVAVEPGVAGAVITGNAFADSRVDVTDAPGTVITGNTVVNECDVAVRVAGASPGVRLHNNIVQTASGPEYDPQPCDDPAMATAISVSVESTAGSTADHNLIGSRSGGAAYGWGDTAHATLDTFRAATGQGGHDILDRALLNRRGQARCWWELGGESPARDSADASAPGVLRTDLLGNPHADLPHVSNTGTGSGYHDRGAVESVGRGNLGTTSFRRVPGGGFLDTVATALPAFGYPTDGPGGAVAFKFTGDKYWRIGSAGSIRHTFRRAGAVVMNARLDYLGFRAADSNTKSRAGNTSFGPLFTVVGSLYQPVDPTRVLDTRAAVGVPTRTPVPGNSEVVLSIPEIRGVPAADITAVVLNVTATQPTSAGFLTVYPDGVKLPDASNVNFVPKETVPNLVTVPMSNGKLRIRNTGSGTVHVVADLQGWYGAKGSGLRTLAPTRMLDTRAGTAGPFPANTTRQVDLSGKLPAGATAAILNVTVTRPTANGVLKVFPAGSTVPVASNLNFATGQTIPNLVTVPVVAGKVSIHNASSGTTHVIADLAGYYGSAASGAVDGYVPLDPYRIVDTRASIGLDGRGYGGPLQPYEKVGFLPWYVQTACPATCATPTAAVFNMTATRPSAPGVLTAYPRTGAAPPTASNVNFVAGETAANMAVVRAGTGGEIAVYHNSRGGTELIVDQAGFFIAPLS
ncbi:right-handed parallel beta-helix repeat-containing protein [Micromonospora purpureochromogenes]|uniref:right-handed parallel beta-helix repeat-containing protein n=1 Tax=Micromonospora purpureochromogenes TaxID=47872 RepID=UPI0033EE84D5